MTINTLRTINLAEEARVAIRAIRHDGGTEEVSAALAAIMKCSTAYGWTPDVCRNLVYKAWSKRENSCATVRRRRKRIQEGLVALIDNLQALEASVKGIPFPVATPDVTLPLPLVESRVLT